MMDARVFFTLLGVIAGIAVGLIMVLVSGVSWIYLPLTVIVCAIGGFLFGLVNKIDNPILRFILRGRLFFRYPEKEH
ncbi:hypothetical protein GF386_01370 [Candidatus Pacearchaeota archaeon]|nr:hypothetical protein [Candidatus Pacearchaeota archaeon]